MKKENESRLPDFPKKDEMKYTYIVLGYIFSIFGIVFVFIVGIIEPFYSKCTHQKWVDYGDLIDGVSGSFLAFASVLFILHTINEQRKDYVLNKKATEASILSLKEQIKEIEQTRQMHEEQHFETTFFQILQIHNELVRSFEFTTPLHDIKTGKSALSSLYEEFYDKTHKSSNIDYIKSEFIKFTENHTLIFKQFFQSLEKILDFAIHYNTNKKLKRDLLGFVSAQLSYHEEFFLIMYLYFSENKRLNNISKKCRRFKVFDFQSEKPYDFLNTSNH